MRPPRIAFHLLPFSLFFFAVLSVLPLAAREPEKKAVQCDVVVFEKDAGSKITWDFMKALKTCGILGKYEGNRVSFRMTPENALAVSRAIELLGMRMQMLIANMETHLWASCEGIIPPVRSDLAIDTGRFAVVFDFSRPFPGGAEPKMRVPLRTTATVHRREAIDGSTGSSDSRTPSNRRKLAPHRFRNTLESHGHPVDLGQLAFTNIVVEDELDELSRCVQLRLLLESALSDAKTPLIRDNGFFPLDKKEESLNRVIRQRPPHLKFYREGGLTSIWLRKPDDKVRNEGHTRLPALGPSKTQKQRGERVQSNTELLDELRRLSREAPGKTNGGR